MLGNCYYYLSEFEQAVTYYQRALQLDPGYEDARNNLGISYRDAGRFFGEQKGDLAKSLEYLEQAYQMRPGEYETVRLLGVALGISGQQDRAISLFEKGTLLKPEDADAWFNLGTAYYNAGQLEKANENFQKALEIDPEIQQRRQNRQ